MYRDGYQLTIEMMWNHQLPVDDYAAIGNVEKIAMMF